VGHLPEDIVKISGEFDIWMDNSEITYPLNVNLMGILCSDNLKKSKDRGSVFLDPTDDDILKERSVDIKAHYTDPDGKKITTSSNTEKRSCIDFSNRSPDTYVSGEWSVYATALWMEDETLYEASSHSVTFQVNEPIFQGMIEKIPLKNSWENVTPLDWSGNGQSILFTYTLLRDENSLYPQLAIMSLDNYDVTTLDIPMFLDTDEQIRSAKFSPDGKFIHFVADDGNLFRYDIGTSHVLKLTHHSEEVNFDYYHYSEDDPNKYSIIVSVDKKSHLEDYSENGYILFDIGNGEGQNSILDAHALVFNFESLDFDISPDGKKILFQKTIESDYGWADRILAYHPAQGEVVEIPNSQVNCGAPPKWAPGGDMIIYNVHSCGRGAPGGTLHLISDDGSYHELILPYDNHNPDFFVISPDGIYLLYVKGSNFEMMTLAKAIPEFEMIAMMIMLVSVLPIIMLKKQLVLK
jgi:WD40 repeat protein